MAWGWNPSPPREGTHSSRIVKQLSQSMCWRKERDGRWCSMASLFLSFHFSLTLHPWDSSSYIQDGSSLLSWNSLQTPSLTHPEMCSTVNPKPIKLTMRSNYGMNGLWNLLWDSIKMKVDRRDTHTQSNNCLPWVHGRAWDPVMRLCYGQCMRVLLKILFWNLYLKVMLLKGGVIGRWLGLRDYPHVNEKLFLKGLAEPFFFLPVRYHIQSREQVFSDTESSGILVLDFWVLSTGTIRFYWT